MFNHQFVSAQYFPPVWFAPGDESHLLPEEIRTGGARKPRARVFPVHQWTPAPSLPPYRPEQPVPVDEEEALMLCAVV